MWEEDDIAYKFTSKKNKAKVRGTTPNLFPDIKANRGTFKDKNNSNKTRQNEFKEKSIAFDLLNSNGILLQNFNKRSQSPTKDFFNRKTQTNFIKKMLRPISKGNPEFIFKNTQPDLNGIYLNVLKEDIIQIDEMIKKHSDVIKYFPSFDSNCNLNTYTKANNFEKEKNSKSHTNTLLQNKLKELNFESKIEINNFFQEIENKSKSLEYLYKEFHSNSQEDLISKLASELFYSRLFINKINSLTILLNLKYNERKISENFKENSSKFNQMKILFKMIIEKFIKIQESVNSSFLNLSNSFFQKESSDTEKNFSKVLEFNSITQIFNFECEDPIIKHIKFLLTNFCDKSLKIFVDLIMQISKESKSIKESFNLKIRKNEDTIESLILIRKYIEDRIREKDKIISESKIIIENLKTELEKFKENSEITKHSKASELTAEILLWKIQEESK